MGVGGEEEASSPYVPEGKLGQNSKRKEVLGELRSCQGTGSHLSPVASSCGSSCVQQLQPPKAYGLAGLGQANAKVGPPSTLCQCGTQPARRLGFPQPGNDGHGPSSRGGSCRASARDWPIFSNGAGRTSRQTTGILIYSPL